MVSSIANWNMELMPFGTETDNCDYAAIYWFNFLVDYDDVSGIIKHIVDEMIKDTLCAWRSSGGPDFVGLFMTTF